MFGRGRWQTIIRFTSFIVHADAIYAMSLLWVPASSLFSCLIEGCCDTAIQGRDCRGQHSSDQALHIKQYKSSISTTTCHVFKHRNVADGTYDAWESFHGKNFFAAGKMLESSLQSRHSWKREVSPCCFAWQFVNDSKHNLQWDFLDMAAHQSAT